MMQKIQRFGAAMFVPVMLFSFAGIVVALGSLFNNPTLFGLCLALLPIQEQHGIQFGTQFQLVVGLSSTKKVFCLR